MVSAVLRRTCSSGQDSKIKSFLRRGVEILADIAIIAGLGVGLLMIVIGLGG
jgi:hypothetical protein